MEDFMMSPSLVDMYQSSKNKEWRSRVKAKTTIVYRFLRDHGLSKIELLDESGDAIEDLVLMRSHLTDAGAKLFEKAIPAWDRARDKDGNLSNLTQLENGLKKILAEA
ncbi:hypothetical protein FHR56_001821 [Xanthomonas sacchari]|uniref:hypothetical protein n=1 Tax=unclassified Xanthomonas TaxID=2643310 RepID=UPI00136F2F44|nr:MULTISPECIES: hypothetical protein [unclassified Xanthomonas]MBB6366708.1 hypothetical protein [Xanthomonas sp. F10]